MANYVDIKPSLIKWAINRSGLKLDDYTDAVRDWVASKSQPTIRELNAFAKKAMVPVGYLFLEQPPDEKLPIPDYRTRTDRKIHKPSPNLLETVFEMEGRQEWMREYLIEQGHGELSFVASSKIGDNITVLANRIRKVLGLSESWAQEHSTWEDALRHLRKQIEDAGILIFVNGIVGNNTRRSLDADEFQGFVLADKIAPLIFVNSADFKVAQMFTIAHELAHVWTGQSALFDLVATIPANIQVEKYCNAVAAEFLVPAKMLEEVWPKDLHGLAAIKQLARRYKVSEVVLARRANDKGLISKAVFLDFFKTYAHRDKEKRDAQKGGDFWRNQNLRIGRRYGLAVVAAVREGRLSYTEAYSLTRLSGETFEKYARRLHRRKRKR
jgi:Zn-dependent peptidase ImmA (M78 family)